jgi:putative two-component system response regulator
MNSPSLSPTSLAWANPHAAQDQMLQLMTDMRHLYAERNQALVRVTQAHHDTLLRLALAAEYRDGDTGTHIARIGLLAEAVALALDEPADWAAMLRRAAPMHDIGKIGIRDAVRKKEGPLSPDERQEMNRHPQIGAEILGQSQVPVLDLAAEVALTHHERWDGRGYPHGRQGPDIPLSGRIVAVVDFFDALTMDRCYRPAFTDEEALRMLGDQSGRQFDPRVVQAFLHEAAALVRLRNRINARGLGLADLVVADSSGFERSQLGPLR